MRTQVGIVGGGPAGLLLARLLHLNGIDSVVVEQRSQAYVEARIRAGVLETGSVDLLNQAGVGARMLTKGLLHDGVNIAYGNQLVRIDMRALSGHSVMIYGQTEITKDLYAAHLGAGGRIIFEADEVRLNQLTTDKPVISYRQGGQTQRIECDFIAGCDGFHGCSRQSIPGDILKTYERIYPVGWLGVLSDTPPVNDELIYASHERGFALCSMRSTTRSRYYIQCPVDNEASAWSDQQFFDELKRRLPQAAADTLISGDSIEKSIAPLRSFVAEPMRFGNLFLAGDAAHIVPPTGAKGLNLAVSDVRFLFNALRDFYQDHDQRGLDDYSRRCLTQVWQAERFSWWFTQATHRLTSDAFDQRIQLAELRQACETEAGQALFSRNYVGLRLDESGGMWRST